MTIYPIKLGNKARWLELAALGCDAWNTWADSELKKPKAKRATVDLGGRDIPHTDWGGFKFPGPAHFNNVTFLGEAHFANTRFFALAWFAGSTFPISSSATFQDATFRDRADFKQCLFDGLGFFNNVRFESDVSFNGCRFKQFAHFYGCAFEHAVDFSRVWFDGNAGFGNTVFSADARFLNAKFHSTATFDQASFKGTTRFDGARFKQPPDFTTSDFTHGPSFQDTIFDYCDASDAHTYYRRLKKFAIDANDHQRELDLFALETKARRGHTLKWGRPRDWLELVLSHLYEITSDFGRSILRPLVALALTFVLAAWRFALLSGESGAPWTWKEPPWVAAFANLLPYAGQATIGRQVMETGICPPVNSVPNLYCLTWLYGIGAIEGAVAVMFLFLLVLGLRNLFRIK